MKSISVQSFEFQINFKEVLSLPMISFSSSSLSLPSAQQNSAAKRKLPRLALGDAKEGIFRGEGSDLMFNTKSSRDGLVLASNKHKSDLGFSRMVWWQARSVLSLMNHFVSKTFWALGIAASVNGRLIPMPVIL